MSVTAEYFEKAGLVIDEEIEKCIFEIEYNRYGIVKLSELISVEVSQMRKEIIDLWIKVKRLEAAEEQYRKAEAELNEARKALEF